MNRNTETHFSYLPINKFKRSVFNIPHSHKTSFDMAQIVPILLDMSVNPGETRSLMQASVVRMQTPKYPIMDNLFMDIYYFYVPFRILWEHYKEFEGENTQTPWYSTTEYVMPKMNSGTGITAKTFFDYIAVPTNVANLNFNDLAHRAYLMIYNEWFRDQNLIAPYQIRKGDSAPTFNASSTDPMVNGKLLKAAKLHDYFTSALPGPQKGPAQTISLGTVAPVSIYGNGKTLGLVNTYETQGEPSAVGIASGTDTNNSMGVFMARGIGNIGDNAELANISNGDLKYLGLTKYSNASGITGIADLTNATAATINALRLDFAIQRVLEKDARQGTRYRELIRSHWGTTTGDARVQIPEYIGGKRLPININQVLQNSETGTTPLGETGAYSCTADADKMYSHSFVERGLILGLAVVRQEHTYQQGLNRFMSKSRRFDWYLPTLAFLGEQGILNSELYAQGASAINPDTNVAYDDEIFGFQERWAEYRYTPSIITAEMRSNYALSLDVWHLGDDYSSMPYLGQEFIEETDEYLKRAIIVQNQNQFWADFYFEETKVSEMPVYSVPGLIDHF